VLDEQDDDLAEKKACIENMMKKIIASGEVLSSQAAAQENQAKEVKKSKASSDRDLTYQSGERVASPCMKNALAKSTNYVKNITQASEMLFESASGLKKAYGMIDYLLR